MVYQDISTNILQRARKLNKTLTVPVKLESSEMQLEVLETTNVVLTAATQLVDSIFNSSTWQDTVPTHLEAYAQGYITLDEFIENFKVDLIRTTLDCPHDWVKCEGHRHGECNECTLYHKTCSFCHQKNTVREMWSR